MSIAGSLVLTNKFSLKANTNRKTVPSSILPLVSGIKSRLPSVNHALISPILPHPVL